MNKMHGLGRYIKSFTMLLRRLNCSTHLLNQRSYFLVHLVSANGLCQQQAASSFHFTGLGQVSSKTECYELCCQSDDCHMSILDGRKCYGVTCAKKEQCKSIVQDLSQFQGHQVNKRSLFYFLHQEDKVAKKHRKKGTLLC